jgi:DNA-binding NarL/FixJ family response regulator
MKKKTRIFIVDDHTLLRDGLRLMLNNEDDLEVVGEADTGEDALKMMEGLNVDLVLMDYFLKGTLGSDAIKTIKAVYPDIHVLALTSYDEKGVIRAMIQAGAISYMLKDAERSELIDAIRSTAQGVSWFSRDISRILLQDLLPTSDGPAKGFFECNPNTLTAREVDVLKLIVAEKTNREIADELFISIKTVENHRSNRMRKIGARNTAGLVKYAIRHSLDR